MNKLILTLILSVILFSCSSTTRCIEVPLPQVQIEYRDRMSVDTILQSDSFIIKEKGDTVFIKEYKYVYKVKEIKDTVNITDTISVVQKITETKEVNRLHNWQVILMILGGAFVALGGYKIIKFIKL